MLASAAALLANLQPPERRLRPFHTAEGISRQGQLLESVEQHLIRRAVSGGRFFDHSSQYVQGYPVIRLSVDGLHAAVCHCTT
jgi:hypothetical protein